jgi:hypothetical protein
MLALQKYFWDTAKLVCRAGGNYGEALSAERGVTQGDPLSSLMFNMCVCVCACPPVTPEFTVNLEIPISSLLRG